MASFKRSGKLSPRFKLTPISALASGLGLVVLGSMLLFSVFVSQTSLQQRQDTASQASVPSGQVTVSLDAQADKLEPKKPAVIDVLVNTNSKIIEGVELTFDIVSDADLGDLTVTGLNTSFKAEVQELQKVAHGYKVHLKYPVKDNTTFKTTQPQKLLSLSFLPNKDGKATFSFNKENSHSYQKGATTPTDLLTHIPAQEFLIGSAQAAADDLYLVTDEIESRFTIKETTGSLNEVNKNQLVNGRSYSITHQAKIQNTKDTNGSNPIITAKLIVNDDQAKAVSRTFNLSTVQSTTEPATLQFETTFTAKDTNKFIITVDSANVYSEADENNNSTSTTFGTSSTTKACNEICGSNADCADSYQCYDTGSDKRCRLNTNVGSTSCTDPFGSGSRTCNQYCANDSDCKSGLTCWNNQCRSPYNTASDSCPIPSTQQLQEITDNCNKNCSANKDCPNNMRCLDSQCRLATNPSSTSCSAMTATTVSQAYTRPTPVPTARPSATPVAAATPPPTPSATPTPTPTPTPEPTPAEDVEEPTAEEPETALQAFIGQVLGSLNLQNFDINSVLSGSLLPVAIIGAGILLLIISIVVMLKPRPDKQDIVAAAPPSVPAQGEKPRMDMHTKPNPTPPPIPGHGVITKVSSSDGQVVSGISDAGTIEMPEEAPQIEKPAGTQPTPAAESQTPTQQPPAASPTATGGTGTTMVQRLKDKGVAMPQQPSPTAPPAQTAPSGWTNEETK